MVSNLYEADKFYDLQKKGKVASKIPLDKRLRKSKEGFYLKKSTPSGRTYKQKISKNDLVYARSSEQGVTRYNSDLDRTKSTQGLKENLKQHAKHAHMGDRVAKTGRKYKV